MAAAPDHLLSWRSLALRPLAVRARSVTGADGVAIALRVGNEMICEASVGAAPQVGSKVDHGSKWSARCLREAQPVSVSHAGEDAQTSYSAILAPVLHCGRAIGFCGAFASRPDAFTPRHMRMLTAIAQAAARAVVPTPRLVPPKTDLAQKRPAPGVATDASRPRKAEVIAPPQPSQPEEAACAPAPTEDTRATLPEAPAPIVLVTPASPAPSAVTLEPDIEEQRATEVPQPSATLSSEVWKEMEAEIAAFAAIEKRRARLALAVRSAIAALVIAGLSACFYPDRVEAWAQPLLTRIQNSLQFNLAPGGQVDISGKPSAAKPSPRN